MPLSRTVLQTSCPRFRIQLLASEAFSDVLEISTMFIMNMKTSAVVAKFA